MTDIDEEFKKIEVLYYNVAHCAINNKKIEIDAEQCKVLHCLLQFLIAVADVKVNKIDKTKIN